MKNILSILTAMILLLALACAPAMADETPQPEGGKQFESNWAIMGGLIEITYEEEGYRVTVDLHNQDDHTGTLWQYSCYYSEEADALESISSSKTGYALNPSTLDRTLAEPEYEELDSKETTSVFSITPEGGLEWKDGRENRGQDLLFAKIGRFEGVWRGETEDAYAEFHWQGLLDENRFFYTVFFARGEEEMHFAGLYNMNMEKLDCYDTQADPIESTDDFLASLDSEKPLDATFSALENGELLFEAENASVKLVYDLLGPES